MEHGLTDSTHPIFATSAKLFALGLLVNNGMVAFYFLPLALAVVCSLLFGLLTSKVSRSLLDIIFLPENQLDKVIPKESFAAA